ncbi:expressed unknown protein [Seminavis robusta]|uniref:Uncharacterized protein n=1 Tax=Seminavis robusta TaxID=568900 RepID=A0A9N8HJJ6_9STRA|nr:expressed unknown protein [Seminavis robusta]|eukprot:Sro770_g199960.1 n/a (110) ;mRNA; f:21684-22013
MPERTPQLEGCGTVDEVSDTGDGDEVQIVKSRSAIPPSESLPYPSIPDSGEGDDASSSDATGPVSCERQYDAAMFDWEMVPEDDACGIFKDDVESLAGSVDSRFADAVK